ncbi:hypothetical protein TNCT_638061 [Trichonephila clavata]|uniref:Uncharacterized protein n=1 Tax=Trichonephila clavata TaxID=2740835 RepID=A0A8X6H216_TRICU|nr:hypothetical protein TNCT_638061 [Trichonephila clavata]
MSDFSVISIHEDTDVFSNGMDYARSLKKFSRFTQRNISGVMEQTSAHSTETPLAKYSKYMFYDDNREQFIIHNAEFEEEEKEIIDIFNSHSEILPSNPFYERGSFNENYHFFPIPFDATPCNPADEDRKENNMPNNMNLEILPSNPFYEMIALNEDYHYNPIFLNASPYNSADEDVQDNNIPNNEKLEIFPSNPFYEIGSCNENCFIPIPLLMPYHAILQMKMCKTIIFPIMRSWNSCQVIHFLCKMGSRNENNFTPIPLNASPCISADEDAQENAVDSSKKKNVLRKINITLCLGREYIAGIFTFAL